MSETEDDSEDAQLPPVLKASVHDLRYFATLLRGVNFVNRATVTIAKTGVVVVVEEARTLLGTAYIFADIFDEYIYHPDPSTSVALSQNSDDDEDNAVFEIPLNTLIECLNIFGTAGASSGSAAGGGGGTGRYTKWKRAGDDSDQEAGGDDDRRRSNANTRGIDQYFGSASDKGTGMRMTYAGSGFPLTLLIAEDATGPTTTCEITTYEAEPHLQLLFEADRMVLKIILKSSWLRDALAELDPSCEKLTFIGNPPPANDGRQRDRPRAPGAPPMLRIQAAGTFGSTEMDYPNDRDVLETFECTQPVRFSYRVGHIARTLRALQSSTKTSLRIDDAGLLSLQFLMPAPRTQAKPAGASDGFIEFRCLALDDEVA
ncbi:Rad1/Rec1/Rad17, partial [Mycena pura]